LITNYKDKYQLKAEIDQTTGDFCRDENGNLDNYNDIWIVCDGKGKVFHFGHSTLLYYTSRLIKGRSIVKELQSFDKDLIFDIEETDKEVLFKFKANNFETIANYIKPKPVRSRKDSDKEPKGLSPFSTKHLRKKCIIPTEKLALYKEITSCLGKDNLTVYNEINKEFLADLRVKLHMSDDGFKNSMKGYKVKDYIYSRGEKVWDDYINYIKNYLDNMEEK